MDHAAAMLDARLFQVRLLSEWLQQINSNQASLRSETWRSPRLVKDGFLNIFNVRLMVGCGLFQS